MHELIPHFQQFDGPWAIYAPFASKLVSLLKDIDWSSHLADQQSQIDQGEHPYSDAGFEITSEGVAIVDVEGFLSKYGSSLSRRGSTVRFRQVLRRVVSEFYAGRVSKCLVVIESGGGTTMGTAEAADELRATSEVLPTWVYIEDIGASAAYWIASRATRVICNLSAIVGSIGTYMTTFDLSKAFSKEGVETLLISADTWQGNPSPHKGAGAFGTEITEEQRGEFKRVTNQINRPFLESVHEARGLSDEQMESVSDGRVWIGEEAVSAGLVDAAMSYDEALAELSGLASSNSPETQSQHKVNHMPKPKANSSDLSNPRLSNEEQEDNQDMTTKPEDEESNDEETQEESGDEQDDEETQPQSVAATIPQLKKAFPKASSDFLLSAAESSLSLDQARTRYNEERISHLEKENRELKLKVGQSGNDPVGVRREQSTFDGDAKSTWRAEIDKLVKGGLSKSQAAQKLGKDQPELRQAYVAAVNA